MIIRASVNKILGEYNGFIINHMKRRNGADISNLRDFIMKEYPHLDKILDIYTKIYDNHYFLMANLLDLMAKNDKSVYVYLRKYIEQFYPKSPYCDVINCHNAFFSRYDEIREYVFGHTDNPSLVLSFLEQCDCADLSIFYDIVSEFIIGFYGYSLIGSSKEKFILTSCNDCTKKFASFLQDGYQLYHLGKVVYHGDMADGYFTYLPALPNRDTFFPFTEYIETCDTNNNRVMIKVMR